MASVTAIAQRRRSLNNTSKKPKSHTKYKITSLPSDIVRSQARLPSITVISEVLKNYIYMEFSRIIHWMSASSRVKRKTYSLSTFNKSPLTNFSSKLKSTKPCSFSSWGSHSNPLMPLSEPFPALEYPL